MTKKFKKFTISMGKRWRPSKKFHWFHCPLLDSSMKEGKYILFWWIGRRFYIAVQRNGGRG